MSDSVKIGKTGWIDTGVDDAQGVRDLDEAGAAAALLRS